MNNLLDITALNTFEDAVAAYEKISAEREQARDPEKINEISAQIDAIFRYISKTFKTRKADTFLLETAPPESAASKHLWSYGIRGGA
jgi:hypothetical protein